MKGVHTHYDNLKVARDAPTEVIRAAYKSLSQKYHPDRNPNDPEASKIMGLINQAYEVLSDPERRRKHDLWIKEQEETLEAGNSAQTSKRTRPHDLEFPMPVSGICYIDNLSKITRENILARVSGKNRDQFSLRLGGPGWHYFWLAVLSCWFYYLFSAAMEHRWDSETDNWYMGLTGIAGILIALNVEWVYRWHSTPLRSLLIVSPLYVMRTRFDKLWFWPIWSITNIAAIHQYTNGIYHGTSLSIHFNGKLESFNISPESAYQALLNRITYYDSRVKAAVQNNDVDYLVTNDDFLDYRLKTGEPAKKPIRVKSKLVIFGSAVTGSLLCYGVAFLINSNQVDDSYHPSSYVSNAPNPYDSVGNRMPEQRQPPRYSRPITAPNGAPWPTAAGYVSGYSMLNADGRSTVTVDNSQNNDDVFVKLVSLSSSTSYPVRMFYIPAHGQFTVESVRAGRYDVRYRDLTTGLISRSQSFQLEETWERGGVQYSNVTMTLYKIRNGNMQTYEIPENEF